MNSTHSSSTTIIAFAPAAPNNGIKNCRPQSKFLGWKDAWTRQLIADIALSGADMKVAGLILLHVNQDSGGWGLLNETIAARTGLSVRQVIRSAQRLRERGHLRWVRRWNQSNFYFPVLARGDNLVTSDVTALSGLDVTALSPITFSPLPLESTCRSSGDGAPSFEEDPGGNSSASSAYSETPPGAKKNGIPVFETIRPTADQLGRWKRDYSAIPDLMAVLRHCDDYLTEHPSSDGTWLGRTSSWLRKENAAYQKSKSIEDEDSF